MDDLDRLYHRLLDAVRENAPHLRERGFRLGDIPQHLLPYRLHRRELGFESVQQYERALVRLAAGERGYLSGDAAVHEAFRRAAADPNAPVEQFLRTFGDQQVALAPDSRHRPDAPPGAAPSAAGAGAPLDPHTAEMAVPTMPVSEAGPPAAAVSDGGGGRATPPAAAPAALASLAALEIPITRTAGTGAPATPAPAAAPPARAPDPTTAAMPFPTRPPAQVEGGTCPHCGRPLPTDRGVTFCPYCGENLTVRRCPACGTELDAAWRFCITCGREVDTPAAAAGAGP